MINILKIVPLYMEREDDTQPNEIHSTSYEGWEGSSSKNGNW